MTICCGTVADVFAMAEEFGLTSSPSASPTRWPGRRRFRSNVRSERSGSTIPISRSPFIFTTPGEWPSPMHMPGSKWVSGPSTPPSAGSADVPLPLTRARPEICVRKTSSALRRDGLRDRDRSRDADRDGEDGRAHRRPSLPGSVMRGGSLAALRRARSTA